jgi:hypothetical protein
MSRFIPSFSFLKKKQKRLSSNPNYSTFWSYLPHSRLDDSDTHWFACTKLIGRIEL